MTVSLPLHIRMCPYFQYAFVGVEMHAAVYIDGLDSVCLYAEESHLMDWEARLWPVCGYQHYDLQRLLLHTGDNRYTHLNLLYMMQKGGIFRIKCIIKWRSRGDALCNKFGGVIRAYQFITHRLTHTQTHVKRWHCSIRIPIWGDGSGGLSWSSAAVCLSPWCTEPPACRAALRMSARSCITLWPTGVAAGAVTHARTTVSAPAASLVTVAPRPLAVWRARTSPLWKPDDMWIQATHVHDKWHSCWTWGTNSVSACWCYCSAPQLLSWSCCF